VADGQCPSPRANLVPPPGTGDALPRSISRETAARPARQNRECHSSGTFRRVRYPVTRSKKLHYLRSPLTESNRRPSPYHGSPAGSVTAGRAPDQPEHEHRPSARKLQIGPHEHSLPLDLPLTLILIWQQAAGAGSRLDNPSPPGLQASSARWLTSVGPSDGPGADTARLQRYIRARIAALIHREGDAEHPCVEVNGRVWVVRKLSTAASSPSCGSVWRAPGV
jgi:hypothetical protein